MDRDELLKLEDDAYRDLVDTLSAVPADRREVEGVVPGWSTHDLLWHCAYWAAYAGDVIERLKRGEPEPVEREDEAAWDAEILAAGRALSWSDAMEHLASDHVRVRAALSAFDEIPQLALDWFTDDTFDHFTEHAGQIREFTV